MHPDKVHARFGAQVATESVAASSTDDEGRRDEGYDMSDLFGADERPDLEDDVFNQGGIPVLVHSGRSHPDSRAREWHCHHR